VGLQAVQAPDDVREPRIRVGHSMLHNARLLCRVF
jgi:hypothetical protein